MPRHPDPAGSTSSLGDSVFQALSRRMKAHEGPLWPLHVGDTWRQPPEAGLAENQLSADHPKLHGYALPQGEAELLETVRDRLARRGPPPELQDLQVCSGATVGLSLAVQSLLDPGDELILPSPFWPLIRGIVSSRGAVPVELPHFTRLREPGFDLEAVL